MPKTESDARAEQDRNLERQYEKQADKAREIFSNMTDEERTEVEWLQQQAED